MVLWGPHLTLLNQRGQGGAGLPSQVPVLGTCEPPDDHQASLEQAVTAGAIFGTGLLMCSLCVPDTCLFFLCAENNSVMKERKTHIDVAVSLSAFLRPPANRKE